MPYAKCKPHLSVFYLFPPKISQQHNVAIENEWQPVVSANLPRSTTVHTKSIAAKCLRSQTQNIPLLTSSSISTRGRDPRVRERGQVRPAHRDQDHVHGVAAREQRVRGVAQAYRGVDYGQDEVEGDSRP